MNSETLSAEKVRILLDRLAAWDEVEAIKAFGPALSEDEALMREIVENLRDDMLSDIGRQKIAGKIEMIGPVLVQNEAFVKHLAEVLRDDGLSFEERTEIILALEPLAQALAGNERLVQDLASAVRDDTLSDDTREVIAESIELLGPALANNEVIVRSLAAALEDEALSGNVRAAIAEAVEALGPKMLQNEVVARHLEAHREGARRSFELSDEELEARWIALNERVLLGSDKEAGVSTNPISGAVVQLSSGSNQRKTAANSARPSVVVRFPPYPHLAALAASTATVAAISDFSNGKVYMSWVLKANGERKSRRFSFTFPLEEAGRTILIEQLASNQDPERVTLKDSIGYATVETVIDPEGETSLAASEYKLSFQS